MKSLFRKNEKLLLEMARRRKYLFLSLPIVKIVDGGLYFILFSLFTLFLFLFLFLFLEQLRLGSISHAVTSVTD